MRIMAIDRGNTRTKIYLHEEGKGLTLRSFANKEENRILTYCDQAGADAGIYCSVCGVDVQFIETLRCLLKDEMLVMTSSTLVPIGILADRSTLGLDRVAAAVGARSLFPEGDLLVVDAGTAITCDYVSARGFEGGSIAPGFRMRIRSLNRYTANLPLVEPEGRETGFVGCNTREALLAGCVGEVTAAILGRWHAISRKGYCRIVVSGGDMDIIRESMDRERKVENRGEDSGKGRGECPGRDLICYDPDLVGKGLIEIYKYNAGVAGESGDAPIE